MNVLILLNVQNVMQDIILIHLILVQYVLQVISVMEQQTRLHVLPELIAELVLVHVHHVGQEVIAEQGLQDVQIVGQVPGLMREQVHVMRVLQVGHVTVQALQQNAQQDTMLQQVHQDVLLVGQVHTVELGLPVVLLAGLEVIAILLQLQHAQVAGLEVIAELVLQHVPLVHLLGQIVQHVLLMVARHVLVGI